MATATLTDLEATVQRERAEVERRGTLGRPLDTAALEALEGDLRIRLETRASESSRVSAIVDRIRGACRELIAAGRDIEALERDHHAGPCRPDRLELGPHETHLKHAASYAAGLLRTIGGDA